MESILPLHEDTKRFDLPDGLALESGERLDRVEIAYRTWGTLDPDGANAVVVCHALTGSADVDGWWPGLMGPGRALDPSRDFIVCANVLGSCYGTTGPVSLDPATGRPYGPDFPAVTIRDMVRPQIELARSLGVSRVRTALGGSLGGMQAIEWALMAPDLVESIVVIGVSGRHSAWCIGLSEAQRQAIAADPLWRDGRYDPENPPAAGLGVARMIAMCTYRSRDSFQDRFGRDEQEPGLFAVESYLRYQGRKLAGRFDANGYVALTRAMDTHDVSRGRGAYEDVLGGLRVPALVVTLERDLLYPRSEQEELAALLPEARLVELPSRNGHDAFLIEVDELSEMLVSFLGSLPGKGGRP